MKYLIPILLLTATPAFAGNPFCGKVVQQKVFQQVVPSYQFAQPYYLYPPANYNQASYRTPHELNEEFANLVAEKVAAQVTGIPSSVKSSIVDSKCGKCHRADSGNDEAKASWEYDHIPLGWKDAARAQYGIVHAGMSQRARLTEAEQSAIVQELTGYLTEEAELPSAVPPAP